MNLPELFHGVKNAEPRQKRAFWELCKKAALVESDNMGVGLSKIALQIWADSYRSGAGNTLNQAEREAFAQSFSTNAIVENTIEKMASDGSIDADAHTQMREWVVDSAMADLAQLTKSAALTPEQKKQLLSKALQAAIVTGTMGTGAYVGKNMGEWYDRDNPHRGAIAGAIPGATTGLLAGLDLARLAKSADMLPGGMPMDQGGMPPTDPNQGQAPPEAETIGEQPQIQDGSLDALEKSKSVIKNLIFLAQQVQLPQLAQDIVQNQDSLMQHFAAGNNYLPPELQHHFAQSDHAAAFMDKYKKRFGPMAVTGSKKSM